MSFVQRTLNMEAATGYVVDLTPGCTTVSVLARGACYVKTSSALTAPSAPTATPAPAASAEAGYLDLQLNEVQVFGVDTDSAHDAGSDQIQYLVVWAVAAGNLVISGH